MDTFPGEHDEVDWHRVFVIALALICGVVIGGLLTTWTYSGEVEVLRMKIADAHEERDLERTERRVFSDGMVGCFERLGQRAKEGK